MARDEDHDRRGPSIGALPFEVQQREESWKAQQAARLEESDRAIVDVPPEAAWGAPPPFEPDLWTPEPFDPAIEATFPDMGPDDQGFDPGDHLAPYAGPDSGASTNAWTDPDEDEYQYPTAYSSTDDVPDVSGINSQQ